MPKLSGRRLVLAVMAAICALAIAACGSKSGTIPTKTLEPGTWPAACTMQASGCTSEQMDQYAAAAFGLVWPFYAEQFPQLAQKRPKLEYIPAGAESETDCKKPFLKVFAVSSTVGPNDFAVCGSTIYSGQYSVYDGYKGGALLPALAMSSLIAGSVMNRIPDLGKSDDLNLLGPAALMAKCATGVWLQRMINRRLPEADDGVVALYIDYAYTPPPSGEYAKYMPTKAVATEALVYGRQHTMSECNQHYLPKYSLQTAQ